MLTEEDARRLVLAEIAQARGCAECGLGILQVQHPGGCGEASWPGLNG